VARGERCDGEGAHDAALWGLPCQRNNVRLLGGWVTGGTFWGRSDGAWGVGRDGWVVSEG